MADELRLAGAFGLALVLALGLTPAARQIAIRTRFLDRPARYKAHARATPYLGGSAVIGAALVSIIAFGAGLSRFGVPLACALLLLVVGTVDDRVGLGILPRLFAQLLAVGLLWADDISWHGFGGTADLFLTAVWVLGLCNAFNLIDNIDGAAGTVGGVAAIGTAGVALAENDVFLAATALALAGACAGFLPFNLARPAKIFLGDGGSMPIGLLLAASIMLLPDGDLGWSALLASAPLVGVAIFDTTLVVVSRRKRGAPILSGARDHVTHRLLAHLGTPARVALVLAGIQALLCALSLALYQLDRGAVAAAAVAYVALGVVALLALEGPALARPEPERAG